MCVYTHSGGVVVEFSLSAFTYVTESRSRSIYQALALSLRAHPPTENPVASEYIYRVPFAIYIYIYVYVCTKSTSVGSGGIRSTLCALCVGTRR